MKKRASLEAIDRKLSKVLSNQNRLIKLEIKTEKEERKELSGLERLEALEKEIEKEVGPHPLRRITYKDIAKSSVGAFIGVVAHYTFVYGIKVASEIDLARAIILFPISYGIGGIFMYATGYRKIKDSRVKFFLPLRLTVVYFTALIIAILVLFLFNPEFGRNFTDSFKQLATVSFTAVIGAATADLIGKD